MLFPDVRKIEIELHFGKDLLSVNIVIQQVYKTQQVVAVICPTCLMF